MRESKKSTIADNDCTKEVEACKPASNSRERQKGGKRPRRRDQDAIVQDRSDDRIYADGRETPKKLKSTLLDDVSAKEASDNGAKPNFTSPPPGLPEPCANKRPYEISEIDAELFSSEIRQQCLPALLKQDSDRFRRLQAAVLAVVESLYLDKIEPMLKEVQTRLREFGVWSQAEIRSVPQICARDPNVFELQPPNKCQPIRITLRHAPWWFAGWAYPCEGDEDERDFSASIWQELSESLHDPTSRFEGSLNDVALNLRRNGGELLREAPLGEIRQLVSFALGPTGRVALAYDPLNGGRMKCAGIGLVANCELKQQMKAAHPNDPVALSEHAGNISEVDLCFGGVAGEICDGGKTCSLANALAMRPLPEHIDADLDRLVSDVVACIESFYWDRIEPTLGAIMDRLLVYGWTNDCTQMMPVLCARRPAVFIFVEPVDDEPCKILLANPPHWFSGWMDMYQQEDPFPDFVWEELATFLDENSDLILPGGVDGAASALKARGPPVLKNMSLGELREMVRHAITEHDLLIFCGENVLPRCIRNKYDPTTETCMF